MSQKSRQELERDVLKDFYAAINRNDIPAAMRLVDSAIERIEPANFPAAGTYCGRDEVQNHLSKGRSTWAEGSCDPEQFIVSGAKFVVFLHVRVKLNTTQAWVEGRFADGFTFADGKIAFMRTFAERKEALNWAGIDASRNGPQS